MLKRIAALLLLAFSFSACQAPTNELPIEEVGRHAFEVLQNAPNLSEDELLGSFISIPQLTQIVSQNNPDLLERVQRLTPELRAKRLLKEIDRIREKDAESGILWEDARYMDLIYEVEEKDNEGLPSCIGDLYFKHDDTVFRTKIIALRAASGKYILTDVDGLAEGDDDRY